MYKCINTDEYGYEMCTMSTHNPKKRVQNAVRSQWSQHWVSSKKDRTINQFSTISQRICTSNTDGVCASLQRVPFNTDILKICLLAQQLLWSNAVKLISGTCVVCWI